jgi:hypothetical protein
MRYAMSRARARVSRLRKKSAAKIIQALGLLDEATALLSDEAPAHKQVVAALSTLDAGAVERSLEMLRKANAAGKLDAGLRQRINAELARAGLDGNGRFEKPDRGWALIWDLLGRHGIEMAEAIHGGRFAQPEGRITVDVAFINPQDSFSPVPIGNTMVVMSWHELAPHRFEVLAYLS